MKVVILYRPKSEHGRIVEEFIENFRSRGSSLHLEVLNIDSRDGSAIAALYDIVEYPSVMVIRDDGSLQKCWQGPSLPLLDEVQAYAVA